ncbi:unnamed protein product [Polarella glacialis]|uniref:Uncharacterized protein n=1 Tax=Polarella glacialis TaxID=89957 RepID=A0A813GRM7_POLGL|nr:unnamed protein product [Polarella glacialis]
MGGFQKHGRLVSQVEVFDPALDSWSTFSAPMGIGRRGLACAVVEGLIYALGGLDARLQVLARAEAFDPSAGTWKMLPRMGSRRTGLAAVGVQKKIYALGGHNDLDGSLASCEVYEPSVGEWRAFHPMQSCRSFLGAVAVSDVLYVLGGFNEHEVVHASMEGFRILDFSEGPLWMPLPSMSAQRFKVGVAAARKCIFAIGGMARSQGVDVANFMEGYDIAAGMWTKLLPQPHLCSMSGVASINECICVVGGASERDTVLSQTLVFDPVSETWTELADISVGRRSFALVGSV